jgi:two-component system response regulator YesN
LFSANTFHLIDHQFNSTSSCIYGTDFDPLIQINTFETLDDLKSWLLNLSYQAIEFIDKHKQKVRRNFVDKARAYLDNNFRDPELNLNKVADHVYISSCYLSRLFKEVTNYTITEYLNKARIKSFEAIKLGNNSL